MQTSSAAAGRIELILGPMFSGKSTELIRRVRRYAAAHKRCLVVKYAGDTRYTESGAVATHDRATHAAVTCRTLGEVWEAAAAADVNVVGIDEAQFFPDVLDVCERLADAGKVVLVAALDGDYRRQPFGRVLELVPRAEDVVKLKAVCADCHGDASFTVRHGGGGAGDALELIGGAETYKAACRACHRRDAGHAHT